MEEGTVVEWLVEEGTWVEKGQQVMVVETEKVTYETEAPASGFFHRAIELNVTVPVLETVALLAETEEELATVRRLGVEYVQGFLLAKPADGFQFELNIELQD